MNKKERMYKEIEKHGENLKAIFNIGGDPVKLSKQIFKIETKAHRLTTDYCNGVYSCAEFEEASGAILGRLDKVLNFKAQGIPVFLNGDARGYALKIRDSYVKENNLEIYRDWGGYGILAPDFRE